MAVYFIERGKSRMFGPFVNSAAVLLGGTAGALFGHKLPERLRSALPMMFGIASISMGIVMITNVHQIPVMVLALVLGVLIGEFFYFEQNIGKLGHWVNHWINRRSKTHHTPQTEQKEFLDAFVAIMVLFCASGTGVFGSMHEGMTGDASILLAKSCLDFFTAFIFSITLGPIVALIAFPQLVIQLVLAYSAVFIFPLTTPSMQADFSSVGGAIMLATGLRICGIKQFAVANMLPALLLAMPLSALWNLLF